MPLEWGKERDVFRQTNQHRGHHHHNNRCAAFADHDLHGSHASTCFPATLLPIVYFVVCFNVDDILLEFVNDGNA